MLRGSEPVTKIVRALVVGENLDGPVHTQPDEREQRRQVEKRVTRFSI